jgi:hypothetical protein
MSTEDLGTQTIDGPLVYGTRRTTVIPAGGREGNDRPMTTTSDNWYSKDLQLTVLTTNFNPASGTSTNKIADHLSGAILDDGADGAGDYVHDNSPVALGASASQSGPGGPEGERSRRAGLTPNSSMPGVLGTCQPRTDG